MKICLFAVLGGLGVLGVFVVRHLTDTTKTPRSRRAPRNTKSDAGHFHGSTAEISQIDSIRVNHRFWQ
jgi:hypothetical protein